jgi:predicted dehydrogenase
VSVAFGLASFAHYHAHHWARAASSEPGVDFVGVWDADEDRGRAAAEQYGTAFFGDLAALAAACDGVGVTSETSRHAELIQTVAGQDAHVLCEKPLARTVAECEDIARIVDRAGVRFMMNFPKRFDPVNTELVRLLRSGLLGRPVLARVRHGHGHGEDEDFRRAWFQDPRLSGGGTLIDEGVHAADLLRWLFGDPVWVSAVTSRARLGLAVDDTAVATFSYADGLIAEISTSWCFQAADVSVEVFGTDGTAVLTGVDLASRALGRAPYLRYSSRRDGRPGWVGLEVTPGFLTPAFHEQGPRRFFRCLANGSQPPVTLEDGVRSVAMIEAAYRAASQGARVRV